MKEKLICMARKKAIPSTREKIVRQKMLTILNQDFKIPMTNLEVEWALSKVDKNTQERADIVIYDKDNIAIAVVECKAPEIYLGQEVLEQALSYAYYLKTSIIYLYNGYDLIAFQHTEDGYKELKQPLSPEKIIGRKIEYADEFSWQRQCKGFEFDTNYIQTKIDLEWISKNTPRTKVAPIVKIQDMLYDNDWVRFIDFDNSVLRFREDHDVHARGFKVHGYRYFGPYRSFELEDAYGIFTMYIGSYVMGFDHSYLFIAINRNGKSGHAMELNLDKFLVEKKHNTFAITHNGKMYKKELKEIFLNNLNLVNPKLKITEIALFDNSYHSFYLNDIDSLKFLDNILTYSYVRYMTKNGESILNFPTRRKTNFYKPTKLKINEIIYFVSQREFDKIPNYLLDAQCSCSVIETNKVLEINYDQTDVILGATISLTKIKKNYIGKGFYTNLTEAQDFSVKAKTIHVENKEFIFGWQEDILNDYTFILRVK